MHNQNPMEQELENKSDLKINQIDQDLFLKNLLCEVFAGRFTLQRNNHDLLRFPLSRVELRGSWLGAAKQSVIRGAAKLEFVRASKDEIKQISTKVASFAGHQHTFSRGYELLEDQASRDLMISLLAYRILGERYIKLPTNNSRYWANVTAIEGMIKERGVCKAPVYDWHLHLFDLEPCNYPLEIIVHDLHILCTFLQEQYKFSRSGKIIEIEAGDVVIDAGGCWGDTALYAAHRVGEKGRVFTFEFSPDNLPLLEGNLSRNPTLSTRIEVITEALWDVSGEELNFDCSGPGTSVSTDPAAVKVQSKTVDDFVRDNDLSRVDFIKMDIEGSELKALKGAEWTMRTFRPKLAIALYHKEEDFYEIPDYLNSLDVGYKFYLDHFTIHSEETVLFASAERPQKNKPE